MGLRHRVSWVLALGSSAACGPGQDASAELARRAAALVHGTDARAEFFEAAEGAQQLLEQSAVALFAKQDIAFAAGGLAPQVLSLAERDGLCPDERFGEQPSAAFCSGVLVDWDLLLTAAHCARALPIGDLSIVLGYYYTAAGELATTERDVLDVVEIVAEAHDPAGTEPRLDYAWMRLSRSVDPPRGPAGLALGVPLAAGAAVLALNTPGGTPFKADAGGAVQDVRAEWLDYFTADTDTSHGASGGGAFDDRLSLVGVLARGGTDYMTSERGCRTTLQVDGMTPSEEQFTYAATALAGLCEREPNTSLCRADCGDPCVAGPRVLERDDDCSLGVPDVRSRERGLWALLASLLGCGLRRRTRCTPSRAQRAERH